MAACGSGCCSCWLALRSSRACSPPARRRPTRRTARSLYNTWCAGCHGADPRQSQPHLAADRPDVLRDAISLVSQMGFLKTVLTSNDIARHRRLHRQRGRHGRPGAEPDARRARLQPAARRRRSGLEDAVAHQPRISAIDDRIGCRGAVGLRDRHVHPASADESRSRRARSSVIFTPASAAGPIAGKVVGHRSPSHRRR